MSKPVRFPSIEDHRTAPPSDGERGSAMVLALGVIVLLAVLALVAISVVVTEKRTDASGYTASRSFYSADAATEAGINWLRQQSIPPAPIDTLNNVRLSASFDTLSDRNRYRFDVQFLRRTHRPGWSLEYKDYEFQVGAVGVSGIAAESAADVEVSRLYREGY